MVVGPDYVRPTVITPDAYKENDGWKVAQPKDDVIRGSWWEMFGDPQLNALAAQVSVSNQNLAAAEAQYREARALVQEARAAYFPTATIGIGANRSSSSTTTGTGPASPRVTVPDYSLALDVSWEIDVWGRIRRSVESNQANAQASAADLESARLSAQAALAQDYFQLRELDAQKQLLTETVAAFEKSLELTRGLYAQGVDSEVDVVQAETQLKTTQAQLISVGVQRAQLEHAIAVLIGKPASDFSIPATPLAGTPPEIPFGVPSELLERRPDIAASERLVAAANAQIGVAEAAFLPNRHSQHVAWLGELEPGEIILSGESLLVGRGIHFGDRIRRWSAAGADRLRTGGLRRDRRKLSADRADGLSGGGGQSSCASYPRAGSYGAERSGNGGRAVRLLDVEPIPGGHGQLSQRDHGADNRPHGRVNRNPDSRPAHDRCRPPGTGLGRRLERIPTTPTTLIRG